MLYLKGSNMLKFGLACEGITDHAVLESILLGTFDNLDEDEIIRLQPSDPQKGGWNALIQYLGHSRFREDLNIVTYVIIQIDTDIAEDANIQIQDDNGNRLSDQQIVLNTISRLTQEIENNHKDYVDIQGKIIFAISVESIECWLINSHARDSSEYCNHDIKCFDTLKHLIEKIGDLGTVKKKRQNYLRLSRHLEEDISHINELAERDMSFNMFFDKLKECEIV